MIKFNSLVKQNPLLHMLISSFNGMSMQCKSKGLKVAVASSADRIKVDANLAAAGLPLSM